MHSEQDHIELIERYLEGSLSFQELMEQGTFPNKQAAEQAIDSYQVAVDDVMDEALAQELKVIHEELYPEKPVRSLKWLGLAATFVLIAVFGYLLIQPTSEVAFDEYFEAYPYYDLSRGDDAVGFERAMENYANGDFSEAWRLLTSLSEPAGQEEFAFYKGVCALAVGEYEEATKLLRPISEQTNHTYTKQARWYLALSLWQAGKLEEARALLKTIEEGGKYYEKAQKLKEQL